jgi:hypothetical protein
MYDPYYVPLLRDDKRGGRQDNHSNLQGLFMQYQNNIVRDLASTQQNYN